MRARAWHKGFVQNFCVCTIKEIIIEVSFSYSIHEITTCFQSDYPARTENQITRIWVLAFKEHKVLKGRLTL